MQGKCKKNGLNIAVENWNGPENQTWGISVIVYHENNRGGTMKSPTIGVWSAVSPFGNYDPSCEMLRYGRCEHHNLCQTLPNFFHAIVRARHSDTMIFVIFWTLYAFSEIKIPTRPTPLAAPRGRTIWSLFPFLAQWMKTRKATHKWSC